VIEVVFDDLHRMIGGEARAQPSEHRVREINCDGLDLGSRQLDQREQTAISAAEIQHPSKRRRQELEQRRFALGAVGNRIGLGEVFERVLRCTPKIDVGGVHQWFLDAIVLFTLSDF
jgi:hypothetical protein